MRFPVLTPTEAPQWFSQAFEDAEREYCHYDVLDNGGPTPETMSVWLTLDDAYRGEIAMGLTPVVDIVTVGPLDRFIDIARSIGRSFVVLRDAQGNELKRWSVLA